MNGVDHVSGGISSAERQVAISRVDLETKFVERPGKMPVAAATRVYGVTEAATPEILANIANKFRQILKTLHRRHHGTLRRHGLP